VIRDAGRLADFTAGSDSVLARGIAEIKERGK
jgi:hypothetical protein